MGKGRIMDERVTSTSGRTEGSARAWRMLRPLLLGRPLVAAVALPVGLLMRPDLVGHPSRFALLALVLALGVSAFWMFVARRVEAVRPQLAAQLGLDLVLVTALAACTGGEGSQFVLFYMLVVITGGVFGRLTGGLLAAAGAVMGFLWLPRLADRFGASLPNHVQPEVMVSFLACVGILAGVLGERVQRTVGQLARTERELDRVRLDNGTILRHLATGILTVDADGRVNDMNPAAENVLGLRAEDVRGLPLDQALPPRLAALRELIRHSLRTRTGRARAEVEVAAGTGRTLPLGASTNVLLHEDQLTGIVAVFQDLSAVRDMERRVRRSETLAEVGALAAGIAHELRNGLKPISGSVEVLQRELKLEGETAELMDLVARESARLNKFVTDLLTYSRERDLALEPVSLELILRDLAGSLRHDPRRATGVVVEVVPGTEDVQISVDTEQMRQVWLNLASNALEAMGERGTLTITWVTCGEGQVAVEFRDQGPGIPADDLRRMGEPFFTTKRGGTGLGLAIAQRIVERHAGVLTLESVAGQGTTARVQLPGQSVLSQAA